MTSFSEVISDQPHLFEVPFSNQINHLLVFFLTHIAQFTHLPEDAHLMVGLNKTEVVQCGFHAGWVGVIGVHHQFIVFCDGQLTAVVRWGIFSQRVTDVI